MLNGTALQRGRVHIVSRPTVIAYTREAYSLHELAKRGTTTNELMRKSHVCYRPESSDAGMSRATEKRCSSTSR